MVEMAQAKKPKAPKKPVGAAPKVDAVLLEQILIWYAQHGNQHVKASQHFGLSRKTLSGMWFQGYGPLGVGPLKQMVQTVEVKARALRATMKEEEIAKMEAEMGDAIASYSADKIVLALDDAATTRAQEGMMVAVSRRNVTEVQGIIAPILGAIRKRVPALKQEIEKMDATKLLYYLRELSKFMNDVNAAAKTTMDMERTLMGDPDARKNKGPEMGQEEAQRILAMSMKAYNRLQNSGKIVDTAGESVPAQPLIDLPIPAVDNPSAAAFALEEDASEDEGEEEDFDADEQLYPFEDDVGEE